MLPRFLFLLFLAIPVWADDLPAWVINLARIQRIVADNLKRLPDYTCLETIDRYAARGKQRMRLLDRARVAVAVVDKHEMYAWPGDKSFGERSLIQMLPAGFVSDGDFTNLAHNVFLSRAAVITFSGEEQAGTSKLLRYDYRIPQTAESWMVRLRGASGTMGVKGSFWADASTFELVRLTSEGEDLPAWFPDKSLSGEVAYGRVRFGASVILLPVSSDMHAESFTGARRWNHSTFTGCRKYSSESVISYAETGSEGPAESKVNDVVSLKLRPGIELELRLDATFDSGSALVGDSVRGRLTRAVHLADDEILPRGAVAMGVIRNLERQNQGEPYYTVGLEFNE
ncbi:MAG TPA: hypothetical protein VHB50_00420, partial [Bryobacteraceae bacterium]|nr:hypothetical protein [Bryobacteraceae bacterium]